MMVLASCTKTKVESIDGPKEIAFRTIESNLTKAPTTIGESNNATMGVYAFTHGTTTAYFSNTSFGADNAGWKASPSKYWPLTSSLDFVVYSPWMNNISYDPATKKLTFTIPDNKTDQIDYLYGAEYFNNQTGADGNGYTKNNTPVNVNLKHALSKVTVIVKADVAGLFTLESLSLNNLYPQGTLTVQYGGDDKAVHYNHTPEGTQYPHYFINSPSTPVSVPINEDLTRSHLVFPSGQTEFTISYKVNGISEEQNIPLSGEWLPGKHYTYTITLTATEILFNPSVDGWETCSTSPIQL